MIVSKEKIANGKKYIYYSGRHDELRDMLKEGDLATLLWQNEDTSESIKISGVVKHIGDIGVHMSVCGSSKVLIIEGDCCYKVTSIKRPVENMLPDSPGPWFDKNLDTWIVDDALNAIRVTDGETWLTDLWKQSPDSYSSFAPFKKIDVIKEKVSNEQA